MLQEANLSAVNKTKNARAPNKPDTERTDHDWNRKGEDLVLLMELDSDRADSMYQELGGQRSVASPYANLSMEDLEADGWNRSNHGCMRIELLRRFTSVQNLLHKWPVDSHRIQWSHIGRLVGASAIRSGMRSNVAALGRWYMDSTG